MDELCCLGVKRGSFNRIHDVDCDVVEDIHLNPLNSGIIEGCVYAVPNGSGSGGKLGSIAFDNKFPFMEGDALLCLRGFGGCCGCGRRGRLHHGWSLLLLSGHLCLGALRGSGCRCGCRRRRCRRRRRRRR
jgi:hypothetical protein